MAVKDYQKFMRSSRLYPVLVLERQLGHRARHWLLRLLKVGLVLLGVALILIIFGRGAATPLGTNLLTRAITWLMVSRARAC
jgi:hypothetical protein